MNGYTSMSEFAADFALCECGCSTFVRAEDALWVSDGRAEAPDLAYVDVTHLDRHRSMNLVQCRVATTVNGIHHMMRPTRTVRPEGARSLVLREGDEL